MKNTKRRPRRPLRRVSVPKECFFCKEKKEPTFWEEKTLQRFLTEREKIIPRSRSGLCAAHQRLVTRSIKHARLLAILPFISRV